MTPRFIIIPVSAEVEKEIPLAVELRAHFDFVNESFDMLATLVDVRDQEAIEVKSRELFSSLSEYWSNQIKDWTPVNGPVHRIRHNEGGIYAHATLVAGRLFELELDREKIGFSLVSDANRLIDRFERRITIEPKNRNSYVSCDVRTLSLFRPY